MKKELERRKRKFWSICLAMAVLCGCIAPMGTFAANYSHTALHADDLLLPGDTIAYEHDYDAAGNTYAAYDPANGLSSYTDEVDYGAGASHGTYTVKRYEDVFSTADPAFKAWKVTYVWLSGGYLGYIKLSAERYTESDITYVLDGGTTTNPDTYYEGKEPVVLSDAVKVGYTFDGWYTAASFDPSTQITEIPVTQTGVVTLYAKFVAAAVTPSTASDTSSSSVLKAYNVSYELDGGTNGEGNPQKYTQGVGVASLADAAKTGYTFAGWYTDAAYTNQVTCISSAQTGDITLYARFTGKVKDEVPKTGETAGVWLLGIMLVSGAGVILSGKTWKKKEN